MVLMRCWQCIDFCSAIALSAVRMCTDLLSGRTPCCRGTGLSDLWLFSGGPGPAATRSSLRRFPMLKRWRPAVFIWHWVFFVERISCCWLSRDATRPAAIYGAFAARMWRRYQMHIACQKLVSWANKISAVVVSCDVLRDCRRAEFQRWAHNAATRLGIKITSP